MVSFVFNGYTIKCNVIELVNVIQVFVNIL